ncbi:MAG: substrate-binding domain-containing protein [Oscillospiraceae bacterium]|nr:substrate-binding domain-containing protein [Oscillospiraceae bacterium]
MDADLGAVSEPQLPLCCLFSETHPLSALTLVRAGYGFTIAPRIEFNSSEIKFVPLQGEPPLSYGMFRKSGGLSPHVKSFVSMVKENA